MEKKKLFFRGYLRKEGNQWTAVCIDLCLAAQADSCDEADKKMAVMIADYLNEATSEDKEYARQLLDRKAPLSQRLTYHYAVLKSRCFGENKNHNSQRPVQFKGSIMPIPA